MQMTDWRVIGELASFPSPLIDAGDITHVTAAACTRRGPTGLENLNSVGGILYVCQQLPPFKDIHLYSPRGLRDVEASFFFTDPPVNFAYAVSNRGVRYNVSSYTSTLPLHTSLLVQEIRPYHVLMHPSLPAALRATSAYSRRPQDTARLPTQTR